MSGDAAPVAGGRLAAPAPPAAAVRVAIARRLFLRTARRMPGAALSVLGPTGEPLVQGAGGAPELRIIRDCFFRRLGAAGKIGFGEAYMAGDWETSGDLAHALRPFAANLERLVPAPLQRLRPLIEPRLPRWERNTISGAARNSRRHYDLSNGLFAVFLDETMTYSCAIFQPGDSLRLAQRRKYAAIAELAGVGPGHHVLKVGTRWGGMAREQYDLARERVAASGVGQLVDVQLCDYRDLRRRFDRIVSIEMFEAVGEEHWPTFFAACDGLLVPGGHMVMQPITMPHRRYLASRRSHGWIHEYIFPGGLIPPRRRSMPPPRGGRRCG